jgi:hypothetical protein
MKITPEAWFGAELLERLEAQREARRFRRERRPPESNIYFQVASALIVGAIAFGFLYLVHLTGL